MLRAPKCFGFNVRVRAPENLELGLEAGWFFRMQCQVTPIVWIQDKVSFRVSLRINVRVRAPEHFVFTVRVAAPQILELR